MKNPAVLWYPSDFISSTIFWNNEQCGAYIRLLNYQFTVGHLTKEQLFQITKDEMVLSKFIEDENGMFYNKRMELEIEKRQKYSESRSKNKLGKTKSYEKDMKNISKSYENHMGNENINININKNIIEIIDYLNNKINSNYKYNTSKTINCIKTRLKEKYTIDDFKIVIDKKVKEWKDTEMEKYLRPETLFGTKFESYLNQKEYKTQREKIKAPEWLNKNYNEKDERKLSEEDYEIIRKIKEADRREKAIENNNV